MDSFDKLPTTCADFSSYCSHFKVQDFCQVYQNPEACPLHSMIHFSVGALDSGRPLGGAVVFVCGPSASGKSSTINALYQCCHSDLCRINGSAVGATTPVCVSKPLEVIYHGSKCSSSITLVDTPGLFDSVISNPAVTYATLSKTTNEMESLKQRKDALKDFRKHKVHVRDDVFPNIVLFTIKSTENRLLENNSILRRSLQLLREVKNLVDLESPNLIVVLTNSLALGQVRERFELKLKERVEVIREVVREVFGFDKVPVIPIENQGEDYDLENLDSYHKLPNNTLSHQNLLVAIKACCSNNGDTLGEAVFRAFSDDRCKEAGVTVKLVDHALNRTDLSSSEKHLLERGICTREEYSAEVFYFRYFGKGIWPRTEKYTKENLLATSSKTENDISMNLKTTEIDNHKFLVPACVQTFCQKKNHIMRLTFIDKVEYDDHMKRVYNIEPSISLVTDVDSTGKWVNRSKVANYFLSHATVNFAQIFQLATFKMTNPRENVACTELGLDIAKLPASFLIETSPAFHKFFEKWGTHIVSEQSVGGMIVLTCKVSLDSATQENLAKLTAAASTVFEHLWGSGSGDKDQIHFALKNAGVSDYTIKYVGGLKMENLSHHSTPQDLQKWVDTIAQNPVELRHTTRLFPHYELIEKQPERAASLRKATHAYLAGELKSSHFKFTSMPSFEF